MSTPDPGDSQSDLDHGSGSYYRQIGPSHYQPTLHTQGAWSDHEQHMGPVSGLIAHAIDQHEPRDGMQLARLTFDILGVIPALPSEVAVRTARPGRTIEQVEATMLVAGRPVVRASAWRLSRQDSSPVAGGLPAALPRPETMKPFAANGLWPGGYIGSLEVRGAEDNEPGHGQVWLRSTKTLVENVAVSPTASFVGLVDTANGIAVRASPRKWMFPNIDLSIHLHRQPISGWVGFETRVVFGTDGVGLTSSTLHDHRGPVGRAEQILTVRPLS